MTDNSQTYKIKSILQYKCTQCGGEIQLFKKHTQYVACAYCGTVTEANTEEHKIISSLGNPMNYPPRSFIKLGLSATIDDKLYIVTGRNRWNSQFEEFWDEDGENGYETEDWSYDEWLLMADDNTKLYLIEDEEGFSLSKAITPVFPNLPNGTALLDFISGEKIYNVQEIGSAQIDFFEGESTYEIRTGERIRFASYNGRYSGTYIVEWRVTEDSTIKEIEFFQESSVPTKDVQIAFSDNPSVQEALNTKGLTEKQSISNNKIRTLLKISVFVSGFFLFLSFISPFSKNLASFQIPLDLGEFDSIQSDEPGTKTYITKQPIIIDARYKTCEIGIDVSLQSSEIMDYEIQMEILDQQKEVLHTISGIFFYEYDDEGSNSKTSESEKYRIDRAGGYYLKIELPSDLNTINSVKFYVTGEVMIMRFFLIEFILSLFLLIFIFRNKKFAA